MSDTGILTTRQAALIAGVNDQTIRQWCEALKIQAKKIGAVWVIDEASLRYYVETVRPQAQKRREKSQQFSLGASVKQDKIEENRRRMAQLEADVRSGRVKPLYIPSNVKSLKELSHGTNRQ